LMLPYLVIIVTARLGINVIVVLGFGILTAAIIGLSNGTFTGWEALQSIQKGINWMQNLVIIALTIGGIVSLMEAYGGLTWLMNMVCTRIKSKKEAEFGIASLACLLDLARGMSSWSYKSRRVRACCRCNRSASRHWRHPFFYLWETRQLIRHGDQERLIAKRDVLK
jgi:Na+/H+ antiporter NhaC